MDDKGRVLTPPGTLSFVNLLKPYVDKKRPDREPKYQTNIVFAPGTDLSVVEEMIQEAAKDFFGSKMPSKWNNPLRDNTDKLEHGFPYVEGGKFFAAKSKFAPGIVDYPALEDVVDPNRVYSGVVGRLQVNAYGYNTDGNRGVGIGLDHVQILRDGERLSGGGGDAKASFDDGFAIEDLM